MRMIGKIEQRKQRKNRQQQCFLCTGSRTCLKNSAKLFVLVLSYQVFLSVCFTIQQQQQQYQWQNRIIATNFRSLLSSSSSSKLNLAKKAGSFFNPVPESSNNSEDDDDEDIDADVQPTKMSINTNDIRNLLNTDTTTKTAGAAAGGGISFGSPSRLQLTPKNQKPFVGIGPPLNDVTKPEYDENGYTLYADERTGVKTRVFEALVDYPCNFTMKIVGDGGTDSKVFIKDMLLIVAQSCSVEHTSDDDSILTTIQHTTRANGKWISITVQAPVENAEMLYQLYENIDRDPRVKFKF